MTVALESTEAVQEAVRRGPRILPTGGGSKPALCTPPAGDVVTLDVSRLSGILDYDPAELTITAMAGTPVAEVTEVLARHEQHLPFDPPLAAAGATLGGVVASGTSGANAFRHGGVRDFIIGVRFIDGTGRLVGGGGKVVKNAAGFDLPKLMVGSMGRLGVIVQLSFKVFPRPRATTTLVFDLGSPASALATIVQLARGPLEIDALDLEPGGRIIVRLGGDPDTLGSRAARLTTVVATEPVAQLNGDRDGAYWRAVAELAWVPAHSRVVRVGTTARSVPGLDVAVASVGGIVRYSLAANVAWIALPGGGAVAELDAALRALGLTGMILTGPVERPPLIGAQIGGTFATRIRGALDPDGRFLEA